MKAPRWLALALALATPSALFADDDSKAQKAEQKAENQEQRRIKANLVPAVGGIEVADKAAATIYELAALESLDTRNAKKTVQIARQGIALAFDRTNALKDLSRDARAEATTAKAKLADARTALQRLDKRLTGKVSRNEMEQIREHAQEVHSSLVEAGAAVEQIARAYDVSTDLEFGG